MHEQHMNTMNQRGFSIIELVMALAIITALTVMAMVVFSNKADVLVATPHASGNNSAPKAAGMPTRSTTNSF
jgi:prepilin-type N-terminal cleavage/methylation domain-containing protein